MAIHELKEQIARLPEQPGVYLYFNAAGETIYVGKARALRDRVRNYLGAYGTESEDRRAARRGRPARGHRHRLGRRGAGAREQPDQAAHARNTTSCCATTRTIRTCSSRPTRRFPRVLVARRVERDGSFYAGPFLPAHFARRTMSLTHRLFGIRSCNEVITGKRGRPCLEYDIKRCIAPCVDTICSPEEYGRAVETDAAVSRRARTTSWPRRCGRGWWTRRQAERFEEAAQLRDAMRTVQTLHDRQQKMATAELGHRDVFGMKLGPAGVVIQVFQVRRGRVVERVELGTDEAIVGSRDGEVLDGGNSAVLRAARRAARDSRARASPTNARRSKRGWRSAPATACGSSCRSAARSAASSISPIATPRSPISRGSIRRRRPSTTRSKRCSRCWPAGAAAPDRMLRHLDDSGQRDRRVDGRLRGRPHAARRVPEIPHQGHRMQAGDWRATGSTRTSNPQPAASSPAVPR